MPKKDKNGHISVHDFAPLRITKIVSSPTFFTQSSWNFLSLFLGKFFAFYGADFWKKNLPQIYVQITKKPRGFWLIARKSAREIFFKNQLHK